MPRSSTGQTSGRRARVRGRRRRDPGAVGIDAQRPKSGPAAGELADQAGRFDAEQREAAPDAAPRGDQWVPGDAPSLVGRWAVEAVAKAGNCNHRRYVPELLDLVAIDAYESFDRREEGWIKTVQDVA